MSKLTSRKVTMIATTISLLLASGSALAGMELVKSGANSCNVTYHDRGTAETVNTRINIRNYNRNRSINIRRIVYRDANNNVLFDSNVSGLPVGLSPITARNSRTFRISDIAAKTTSSQRPAQLVIEWNIAGGAYQVGMPPRISGGKRTVVTTTGATLGWTHHGCKRLLQNHY